LQNVRDEVETALVELDGETREELTRSLLEAAAREFDEDDDVRVYGRADDQELIESILAGYSGFEYAGEEECLGGVAVESDASRVRIDNTFDSVLEDVWEDNLKEISTELFEQ